MQHEPAFVPKVKTVLAMVVLLFVILAIALLYRHSDPSLDDNDHGLLIIYGRKPGSPQKGKGGVGGGGGKNVGMVTAYKGGLHWNIMASMSLITKRKYAEYHGYTFYVDNRFAEEKSKNQMRIDAVRTFLKDHSWYRYLP